MPSTLTFQDGLFTTARAVTLPVFSCPFADEGVNERLVLTQDFVVALEDFAPLALDTVHPDYGDYVLVGEGPQTDLGGGIVQWTRTYAKVPTDFTRPAGNYSYNFIGLYGVYGLGVTNVTGRPRQTHNVPVQLSREFALTDDPDADLPPIEAQRYVWSADESQDVDYLADAPPLDEPTSPSRTEYDDLIADDDYNIVVETSTVKIWMGNIYVRETLRVKAR